MARMPFASIFRINTDGSLVTNQSIRIGGVQLPQGSIIVRGTVFSGIDITQYNDHDLEVTTDNGVAVITGIY